MVTATSTLCNAHYPDLDLLLPAGVPTQIPAEFAEAVLAIPGVEIDTPKPEAIPEED